MWLRGGSCGGLYLRSGTARYLWYMYNVWDNEVAWVSRWPPQAKQTPRQVKRARTISWASSGDSPCLPSRNPAHEPGVFTVDPFPPPPPLPLQARRRAVQILFISPRRLRSLEPGAQYGRGGDSGTLLLWVKSQHPPRQRIMKAECDQICCVVVRAEEKTSWRADKRGVTAGGDPSGSRRSISAQNHAYDFSKTTHARSSRLLKASAQSATELCN